MYGLGANNMAKNLKISNKEAKSIIDMFYSEFPNVKKWMDKTLEFGRTHGYVETVYGRTRHLEDMTYPVYGFEYVGGSGAYDPLSFEEIVQENVPMSVQAPIIRKLKNTFSWQKRAELIEKVAEDGIIITDNSEKSIKS